MNKTDTIKLLAQISTVYPAAYRNMDAEASRSTVDLWHSAFPDIPYDIMEEAFRRHRCTSSFAPTVRDLEEQLRSIHFDAEDVMWVHRQL